MDNNRNVVDSTGQFLLTYPVNDDGSVTSKSISDAVPLQLPVTSGDPKATGKIDLGVNLPADAPVITDNPKFADGYQFSASDPDRLQTQHHLRSLMTSEIQPLRLFTLSKPKRLQQVTQLTSMTRAL